MPTDTLHSVVSPSVTLVGDPDPFEMRPLLTWLEHLRPDAREWFQTRDLDQAIDEATGNRFPDLVIVLQSWPEEYSRGEVNRLLTSVPLARIVVCYGAWCESDGRNHNLWPLSVRIPVWAAPGRIRREWQSIRNPTGRQPLPWSASREEIFAADHGPIEISSDPVTFLVDSPDPALRQFLIEWMTGAGHKLSAATLAETIPATQSGQPDLILFDADPWGEQRVATLKNLQARYPVTRIASLASLADSKMVEGLNALGVTHVRHKLGFYWSSETQTIETDRPE